MLAGGVLAAVAYERQDAASDILDFSKEANLSPNQADAYDSALSSRNDLRFAAGVTFASGAALGTLGLFLFLFDEPELTWPERQERRSNDGDELTPAQRAPVGFFGRIRAADRRCSDEPGQVGNRLGAFLTLANHNRVIGVL